jgi:hypothetical protein
MPAPGTDASADRQSTILEADASTFEMSARDAASKDTAPAPADASMRETADSSPATDASARPDSPRPPDAPADAHADADADADAHAPAPGDLQITELLINPAGTDTNREWIEVVNLSAAPLDLHLLTVADSANEVAVDAGVLAPGAILVLGQSLDPLRNGGAPVGFSFGNVISLNNGGDTIRLCLGPCAGGAVIAEVGWSADLGPAFDGHAAVVGASPGGDDGGADAIVFCPADQAFGTAGSFGRPGWPDPPCPS